MDIFESQNVTLPVKRLYSGVRFHHSFLCENVHFAFRVFVASALNLFFPFFGHKFNVHNLESISLLLRLFSCLSQHARSFAARSIILCARNGATETSRENKFRTLFPRCSK